MTDRLHAVHDDDLRAVLEKLGLAPAFDRGDLRCQFCREPVTWDNLHSLMPDGRGSIGAVCDKPSCTKAFLEYLNKEV